MILTITRLDEKNALLVNPKNETAYELLDVVEGWVGVAIATGEVTLARRKNILTGLQKRHR